MFRRPGFSIGFISRSGDRCRIRNENIREGVGREERAGRPKKIG